MPDLHQRKYKLKVPQNKHSKWKPKKKTKKTKNVEKNKNNQVADHHIYMSCLSYIK